MNLSVKLHCQRQDFTLQSNLTIPTGKIIALYGPSGSGKSTFIRAIAGLDKWTNATIQWGNIVWQNKDIFIPAYQRNIGLIMQKNGLFPHLNVEKNILYGYKRNSKVLTLNDLKKQYQQLNIQHLLHKFPKELSGGELQRVSLMRAIASNPQLMILDEAFNALDTKNKQLLLSFLKQYQQKYQSTILYVSHNMQEIAQITDYLLLISNGEIVHHGEFNTLSTNPQIVSSHIQDSYLVLHAKVQQKESNTILIDDNKLILLTLSSQKNLIIKTGQTLRLIINAQDISLSTQKPIESSIPYCLEGTISEITDTHVQIKLGHQHLLCPIHQLTIHQLKLKVNQKIYTQINHMKLLH
jgi:molybdate transport system ATP-binding protein